MVALLRAAPIKLVEPQAALIKLAVAADRLSLAVRVLSPPPTSL